jgi:hypothetical protein
MEMLLDGHTPGEKVGRCVRNTQEWQMVNLHLRAGQRPDCRLRKPAFESAVTHSKGDHGLCAWQAGLRWPVVGFCYALINRLIWHVLHAKVRGLLLHGMHSGALCARAMCTMNGSFRLQQCSSCGSVSGDLLCLVWLCS